MVHLLVLMPKMIFYEYILLVYFYFVHSLQVIIQYNFTNMFCFLFATSRSCCWILPRSAPDGDKKPSSIIKEVIDSAAISSSIYPTVTKINEKYSLDEKKEILAQLWQLVAIDGVINHYEENLYFKIAELLKVKRPHANQIKQEYGY